MSHSALLPSSLAGLLAASALVAQAPAPGHRVFGLLGGNDVWLADPSGTTLHTWSSPLPSAPATYLDADGTLLRTIRTGPPMLPGAGGGIQRLALDGTVLWDFRYDTGGVLSHHDIAILPNGNVLMIAWEDITPAEAIANGRDPSTAGTVLRPDRVIEVQPTGPTSGQIVWLWRAWDHLIQDFDPSMANYGVVGDHPELIDVNYPPFAPPFGDWLHFNGIDYDPVYDRVVVSVNNTGEVWVIDHGTTTAEAAGHTGGRWGKGGDLLYRWGNPESYRAGLPSERVSQGQHCPRFVPPGYPGGGHLMLFLNSPTGASGSAAVELTLPLAPGGAFVLDPSGRYGPFAPTWRYSAPGFFSKIISGVQRLPNGNTLICSGTQGRVFEVTDTGIEVSSVTAPGNVFHAHYVDRSLWTDTEAYSAAAGGSVTLDLIAGSAHAGETYLVLGSISGTMPGTVLGGVRLPLQLDAWMLHTAAFPNSPLLMQTLGTLDALGRAQASLLNLPASTLPVGLVGLTFHHAYVAVGSGAMATLASNAVPLTIGG